MLNVNENKSAEKLCETAVYVINSLTASEVHADLVPEIKVEVDHVTLREAELKQARYARSGQVALMVAADRKHDVNIRGIAEAYLRTNGRDRNDPAFKGIFHKGVGACIKPRGARQVEETEGTLRRMDLYKGNPVVDQLRSEVEATLNELVGQVAALKQSENELEVAKANEKLARRGLALTLLGVFGKLLARTGSRQKAASFFPRNRRKKTNAGTAVELPTEDLTDAEVNEILNEELSSTTTVIGIAPNDVVDGAEVEDEIEVAAP